MVKAIPDGYTAVTPYLVVSDVTAQLDFLTRAFGATVVHRLEMPGMGVMHADVTVFGAHVMMGAAGPNHPPRPAMIYLYVGDADAVHAKALAAGAAQDTPVVDQFYGDRSGSVRDLNGNVWWVGTHTQDLSDDEIRRRMMAAHGPKQGEAK